jgi:hypothetical protein
VHHTSGPIAKAVNEVNVEREMGFNCIRRSESASTLMSTISYFESVFEIFGAGKISGHRNQNNDQQEDKVGG